MNIVNSLDLSNITTNHVAAAVCAGIAVYAIVAGRNRGKKYPPGPKGHPLIGSLFEMPIQNAHVVYKEWAKTYGDMIFFKVLGQPFLILSSEETITDLLDKRSTIYSSRPRMPMVVELMGWDYTLGLLPYGERWRFLRREFHRFMSPTAVSNYRQIQENSVYTFLNNLVESPEQFSKHLRLFYGSISMKVSYGINVKSAEDQYLLDAEGAMSGFMEAGIPGRFWVDLFPALKYVPSWMPGAEFKRKAARWARLNDISLERPFKHVLDQLKKGVASQSVSATLIEELPDQNSPDRKEKETIARNISATTFLGALCLRLRVEHRRSNFAHHHRKVRSTPPLKRSSMPWHNSPRFRRRLRPRSMLWSETSACRLSKTGTSSHTSTLWSKNLSAGLRSGIYHSTTEDDEYKGYFIPKGTIVMTNAWSILTDPVTYPDPFAFKPERYLKNGVMNPDAPRPEDLAFGRGRRICPGRYLADETLFMTSVGVLAGFNISPPLDKSGKPIKLKNERVGTITLTPPKFECRIEPRSPAIRTMIHDTAESISAL